MSKLLAVFLACGLGVTYARVQPSKARPLDPAMVNAASTTDVVGPRSSGPATLRAQVLLARAHFSPGEIDGAYGENTRKAIEAFRLTRGLPSAPVIDVAAWEALNADPAPILVSYTISPEDVAGPFEKIPEDMMEKSKLTVLGYESPLEALAEKFHCSPKLLTRLNPGKSFDKAGEEILVLNVASTPLPKAASIVVQASDRTVTAFDRAGKIQAVYPASIGSQHDPLPDGKWKIQGVARNPPFHYNPALFWDADPSHAKAKIPPGPNNPVGVVWIDLSKDHFGIHGTAIPSQIGRTQSHGCIRLTNWDAAELAEMVAPGTPAILQQ